MKNIPKFLTNKWFMLAAFFVFCTIMYIICNGHKFNPYNNYSYLSQAWLDGHLYVDGMPDYLESVNFMGHQYMHFAPGVSLLCLPFVALFGIQGFNCSILAIFLGACNAVLAVSVVKNLKITKRVQDNYWLAAMLVLGTVHFFCAAVGSSWFLGHVSTLFFLLLAFYFLTKDPKKDKNKYILIFLSGLFFGLAVTCRLATLAGGFFFLGYIWFKKDYDKKTKLKMFLALALGAAIFGSLYMIYNYARFGNIMDMGYTLTYLKDFHRQEYNALQAAPIEQQKELLSHYTDVCGGPLQLKFIPYNLYSIFCMAPGFDQENCKLIPMVTGLAITFTSPMLYYGVCADVKKKMTWVLWLSTLLTAIPFLMNYGNGTAQFGMRYSMDFTPYIWLLMCLGLTKKGAMKLWMKVGITFCFIVEIWGTLYWINNY